MPRSPSNKREQLAQDVASVVGAGKAVGVETVDFTDPNRPKTCLEVDFPILPINQIAAIEGNASKPIYQMSKWWARRRSSVFRSMLLAAAIKAPDDPAKVAKVVWDVYYANHQQKGTLKHLKVADIFMGGGTTVVEGSRLGMQMYGLDLNPVAWFVVKQEFAKVDVVEVKNLLHDIETNVKPQIMPFYYCDGPNGEKGTWTHIPSGRVMAHNFDPLSLTPEARKEYSYEGSEIIYTFWAKHGPCQVTGCGHRTPIMTSPVVAVKTLTVKHWPHKCPNCALNFDVEEKMARIAPDVPLIVAETEKPYSFLEPRQGVTCPKCGHVEVLASLGKGSKKKIDVSLIMHPQWLMGAPKADAKGKPYGGSAQDDAELTTLWNEERARTMELLEVRGILPETVTCPKTGMKINTGKQGGTVPKQSSYACATCGTVQDVLTTVKASAKTGPMAAYTIHGYSPRLNKSNNAYGGRFFAPFDNQLARQYSAACKEWEHRKNNDLFHYWPKEELYRYKNGNTSMLYNQPQHGFTHWWMMFNPRQLLVHTQLLKAILTIGEGRHRWETREYVLGAYQQYLRNQNMFCFWNLHADKLEPLFSNNNYHPKSNVIENSVFGPLGRGNWYSCTEGIIEGLEWRHNPWEPVSIAHLKNISSNLDELVIGKSEKVFPGDPVQGAHVSQGTATDLSEFADNDFDLVITDPPFGALIHYSDLADFFYSWLRIALEKKYPNLFGAPHTPKSIEVIANRGIEPEFPDRFYQRLLTQSWREVHRILKPGGILAFTFHHSKDEPWLAVLESLFDAGFYLEATYPIRSDETKGEGSKPGTFGSQQIEYDIIHVCRKRTEEQKPVSWGRMRREILEDVKRLEQLLENHKKEGLQAADLLVIRRGKALEYFSRHYGKVYVDEERTITVKDALVGINQLLDEGMSPSQEPPPVNAEPITRQFLRIFDGKIEIERDQIQKFLRGTGIAPDEFEDREWCREAHKTFHVISPLEHAQGWIGRHRSKLTYDYDQAVFLIGACFEGSGINAIDTLNNENFKPHPALRSLLEWHTKRGATQQIRNAAIRALTIYNSWVTSHRERATQLELFDEE